MADTFRLEIATPDRPLLDKPVEEAQIPATTGYLGILPHHAPLLAELGVGKLSYKVGGKEESLLVLEGFLEVLPDHVRVLANAAENPSDIDIQRAQVAYDRASKRLSIDVQDVDKARAMRALKRAEARLEAAKKS
jgi:F-type H+-transporting ATPase subunit epsilon